MKSIMQTDVFAQSAKKFAIEPKIKNMVSGKAGKVLTYEDIAPYLTSALRSFRESVFLKAVEDFKNGDLILVYCNDMGEALPPFLPFVKFAKDGKKKVVIDVSYIFSERDGIYSLRQIEALYSLMIAAEYTLELFDPKAILPSNLISLTAQMWAKMFCKVLNKIIALGINRDRYEAFMYFAMQFYCRYILETPIVTANSIAESYLKNGKTPLINSIEGEIHTREIDIYGNFQNFCTVMFNNDITGVRSGPRGSSSEINYVTYMSAFMHEFDQSSLYGLAAFPYFLLMIIRVNVGSRDINRRALEDIMLDMKKYVEITKELNRDI